MELTEQKIINSAIYVFNGDLSASLETVAEKAGVTRRTLHRYFKDRGELMVTCELEMRKSCREAMAEAYNSSDEPLKQLELMLYAGIDCGNKYAFLNKLHQAPEHNHVHEKQECAEYDSINDQWQEVVIKLQSMNIISNTITTGWISLLFTGMIATTVNAVNLGNVARNDVKGFAWFSFSKSIGIQ